MRSYLYSGPVSCVHAGKEVIPLYPGKTHDLPDDHPQVKNLIAAGHLKLADAPQKKEARSAESANGTKQEAPVASGDDGKKQEARVASGNEGKKK